MNSPTAKAPNYLRLEIKPNFLTNLSIGRFALRVIRFCSRLLHLGNKPEDVAQMQAVSKPMIYGWYHRRQSGGVEALVNRPKSGRPLKADDEYSLALMEVIEKEPSEVGYDFAIWTVERLSAHLEKVTGTALSESRLRALLKRKGYRYRRPKFDVGDLQDKQAKSKAADLLEELKKRSSETISNSSLWTKQR